MPGAFQIGFKYETGGTEATTLKAPAPPSGIICTPQSHEQQPHSAIYTTHKKSTNNSQEVRSLSPTKASTLKDEDRISHSRSSQPPQSIGKYFSDFPRMVFFCLCCPTHKCVLWGCLLELIVSLYCWYKILVLLANTLDTM